MGIHPPGHVLLALLADLDIQQNKRVHPNLDVLLELLEPTPGLPIVRVERQGERLAKVVQLQTGRSESSHDRRVVDHLRWDLELRRAEKQVRVRCRAQWVAGDQESDVLGICVAEDLVGFELDGLAVGRDDLFAVELALVRSATSSRYTGFGRSGTDQLLDGHGEDGGVPL